MTIEIEAKIVQIKKLKVKLAGLREQKRAIDQEILFLMIEIDNLLNEYLQYEQKMFELNHKLNLDLMD